MNHIQIVVLPMFLMWCLYIGYKSYKFEERQEEKRKTYEMLLKQIKLRGMIVEQDLLVYKNIRGIEIENWYFERLINKSKIK